jgi:hypothetical protein
MGIFGRLFGRKSPDPMLVAAHYQAVYARGVAMASGALIQQLCRVMQERKVLTTEEIRDAVSEALAMAATTEPVSPDDAEVNRVIAMTIHQLFDDRPGARPK